MAKQGELMHAALEVALQCGESSILLQDAAGKLGRKPFETLLTYQALRDAGLCNIDGSGNETEIIPKLNAKMAYDDGYFLDK